MFYFLKMDAKNVIINDIEPMTLEQKIMMTEMTMLMIPLEICSGEL